MTNLFHMPICSYHHNWPLAPDWWSELVLCLFGIQIVVTDAVVEVEQTKRIQCIMWLRSKLIEEKTEFNVYCPCAPTNSNEIDRSQHIQKCIKIIYSSINAHVLWINVKRKKQNIEIVRSTKFKCFHLAKQISKK